MKPQEEKQQKPPGPSVLVPYAGTDKSGESIDIFLCLRPESNGMNVESILLKVIRNNRFYSENVKLVFFANFPGNYIISGRLIEHHYSYKISSAEKGKKSFTENMINMFESYFSDNFNSAEITGPYKAMELLGLDEAELFNLWVPEKDFFSIYGNTIKKYKGIYIINYDIPFLLQNNSPESDIAVMLFRVSFTWKNFSEMIKEMERCLEEEGFVDRRKPAARVFHYTKSPFEQIIDSQEYLLTESISPDNISFLAYLKDKNISPETALNILENPVVKAKTGNSIEENSIFEFTRGMNYPEAAGFMKNLIL